MPEMKGEERCPSSTPLPSAEAWAVRLGLSKRGAEFVGPCPLCGGADRLHVPKGPDGKALVGCRGCIDGRDSKTKARRFGELLRTVFPDWVDFGSTRQKTGYKVGRACPISPRSFPEHSATSREPATAAKRALAVRLREAAGPADDTPARIYLARRWVWPPTGIGPDLPASVRWLPREAAPPKDEAADWYGIPWLGSAVGAVCFAFHSLTKGELTGVGLEALDSNGQRTPYTYKGQYKKRWRKNVGLKTGAVFTAGGGGDPLVLCEGEVTALAAAWFHPGSEVWATGGTSGMGAVAVPSERTIIIEADGDAKGEASTVKKKEPTPTIQLRCVKSSYGRLPAPHWLAGWPGWRVEEDAQKAAADRRRVIEKEPDHTAQEDTEYV